MNEFSKLRIEARRVRNDAIARARAQYDRTLEAIAALQAKQNSARRRAAPWTMERGIPVGTFTMLDYQANLERMHPGNTWPVDALHKYIHRLKVAGVIKQLVKPGTWKKAVYVASNRHSHRWSMPWPKCSLSGR